MTSAEKITALNNLENLYTETVNYIDAITHSSLYYTDAQAGAKFFGAGNDGAGSGLVAEKLDGYTAEQIIAAGSPSGVIAWWSGSEASIPSGWLLCNGLDGTPDLRNRFIVGAGSHYAKGDTGGSNTVTTTGTVTIAGHSLTAAEIAKHAHAYLDYYSGTRSTTRGTYGSMYPSCDTQSDATGQATGSTGSGDAHTHTATWDGADNQGKRPPFYSLCCIMES